MSPHQDYEEMERKVIPVSHEDHQSDLVNGCTSGEMVPYDNAQQCLHPGVEVCGYRGEYQREVASPQVEAERAGRARRGLQSLQELAEDSPSLANLEANLNAAKAKAENLETLVRAMQRSTDEGASMLLARLRLGASIEELVANLQAESAG